MVVSWLLLIFYSFVQQVSVKKIEHPMASAQWKPTNPQITQSSTKLILKHTMDNGIKPTRLWHLTGKKHFRRIILDRICTKPPFSQRGRRDFVQFVGLVLAASLGLMASYGMFSPPEKVRNVGKCDTSASKRKCTAPKEPCPPIKPKKMTPCSGAAPNDD